MKSKIISRSYVKHSLLILGGIGLLATVVLQSCSSSKAGPYGGDVVPLNNGQAKAEVVANGDTGEVMVHTWDQDLKNSQPVESRPLVLGSGDQRLDVQPHPLPSDPPGFCSRFYGQADWLRGGRMHHGWLSGGTDEGRHDFAWNNCWRGGKTHGSMWSEMREHHRGMMNH